MASRVFTYQKLFIFIFTQIILSCGDKQATEDTKAKGVKKTELVPIETEDLDRFLKGTEEDLKVSSMQPDPVVGEKILEDIAAEVRKLHDFSKISSKILASFS